MSIAEDYVTELDRSLVGPRRVRRGLVQEARDHLDDATGTLSAAGYDRAEAERIAVADFGALEEIVPAFQTTLAVAASRRTALMLFLVLGAQPFLWDGPLGPHNGQPAPDNVAFRVINDAVEYGGGLMIACALALFVATGIGNRWFTAGRGLARLTSITAIASAACIKVLGLSMVLLSSAGDPLSWLLLAAFLVIPLSVTATQARRTLALC